MFYLQALYFWNREDQQEEAGPVIQQMFKIVPSRGGEQTHKKIKISKLIENK